MCGTRVARRVGAKWPRDLGGGAKGADRQESSLPYATSLLRHPSAAQRGDLRSIQKALELLEAIRKMKDAYPDWRIGQLVANVAHLKLGPSIDSVWDIEDSEFIEGVEDFLNQQ